MKKILLITLLALLLPLSSVDAGFFDWFKSLFVSQQSEVNLGVVPRVITAPQGGTGIGTATSGDIGLCLKVLSESPFTYELGSCGSGGGGGGDSVWSRNATRGLIYTPTTTDDALIGATSSTTRAKLEVRFTSAANGSLAVTGSTTLQNFTGLLATTSQSTTTGAGYFGGNVVSAGSVKANTNGVDIGVVSGYNGIWFGGVTPTLANYAFLYEPSTGTDINTPAGQYLDFRVNNGSMARFLPTGEFGIATTTSTVGRLNVDRTSDLVGISVANFSASNNAAAILAKTTTSDSRVFQAGIHTDTTQRFSIEASGLHEWGAGGGSARDTNLFRNAADVLRTSDSLIIDTNLGVGTTSPWAKLSIGSHNGAVSTPLFAIASSSTGVATTTLFQVSGAGVASTTNLIISGINGSSQCLQVSATGVVSGTGGACGVAAGSWATTSQDYYASQFRDWSVVSGTLRPTTTLGLIVSASSTIGNGTQTGGLTISGGSTTTGSVKIGSGSATILFDGATGSATTTQATTTSLYASSYFRLASESGCATFTSGVLTGSGVACGSGSGGGNSKFATSTNTDFVQSNGGLNRGILFGTTTPNPLATIQIASSTGQQLLLLDASRTSAGWAFRNAGGNFYLGTTSPSTFATSTSASAFSITTATSSRFNFGTTTAKTNQVMGIGNNPGTTNGSTTISVGKLQFEGYNSAGTLSCAFVVGTAWVVSAGACNN